VTARTYAAVAAYFCKRV